MSSLATIAETPPASPSPAQERVIVYVDGFNLYFGLRSKRWKRLYWLNVRELAMRLLKANQRLVEVKYFTSHVLNNAAREKRQITFLEALETLPDFHIFLGKYLVNQQTCRNCRAVWQVASEKMTDVNIAVEMLTDAFQNRLDTALLVSADSDLTGPVQAIRRQFPDKRVVVAFPPNRRSWDLEQAAHAYFAIGHSKIRNSQFPETVFKKDGFALQRPKEWQ